MGFVDDEVKRLTATVEKLESRIRGLEEKAFGGAARQSEEIRMILIGPPGAGACRPRLAMFRRRVHSRHPGRQCLLTVAQARAPKPPRSRRSSLAVTW